jgi:hypothetical protein
LLRAWQTGACRERDLAAQMAAGGGIRPGSHCDFKTENVMLVNKDGGERAIVTDFGIARAAAASITAEDGAGGSWRFRALAHGPRAGARREVGPAADIYALVLTRWSPHLPFTEARRGARRRLAVDAPFRVV